MGNTFRTVVKVASVNEPLGLVIGFAVICKIAGEDYHDLAGDHISEEEMLSAALDFAENSRVAKEMHQGEPQGSVPMLFPLTTDIVKALGLTSEQTGLIIAMKPAPDLLAKFTSGELTEFSLGGRAEREDVA